MFKKLTTEEQLQKEREKNLILFDKQIDLENAVLELAELLSREVEVVE